MICPRCGENNPENFKFCGMCGDILRGPQPAGVKPTNETSFDRPRAAAIHSDNMAFSRMESRGSGGTTTVVPEAARAGIPAPQVLPEATRAGMPAPHTPAPHTPAPHTTDKAVEPIAGPSLLGLNQPTPDSIRETTFQGMTTYYPEERHPAWGRIIVTLIFIAGLVAVGWWRYKNYGLPGQGRPSWLSAMNRTTPPNDNPAPDYGSKKADQSSVDQSKNQTADQGKDTASGAAGTAASQAGGAATANPGTADQKAESENSSAKPSEDNNSGSSTDASAKTSDKKAQADEATSVPAQPKKKAAKQAGDEADTSAEAGTSAKLKPAAAVSEGDALFHKGEAYLYGRGGAESCTQAIRYLKSASEKSNAKARSTFGTMYATGHCVPRDLPTSYRWFALALQADPNNTILEKDLSAVWNQMTPPERQLATKLKGE